MIMRSDDGKRRASERSGPIRQLARIPAENQYNVALFGNRRSHRFVV
jgi:hypothetical protein